MYNSYSFQSDLWWKYPTYMTDVKVAQNSFQHFARRRFWWVKITTFYQLMLQSNNCPITGEHVGTISWQQQQQQQQNFIN